jgi:hypothetical protein
MFNCKLLQIVSDAEMAQIDALQPQGHFLESADIIRGGFLDFDSA